MVLSEMAEGRQDKKHACLYPGKRPGRISAFPRAFMSGVLPVRGLQITICT